MTHNKESEHERYLQLKTNPDFVAYNRMKTRAWYNLHKTDSNLKLRNHNYYLKRKEDFNFLIKRKNYKKNYDLTHQLKNKIYISKHRSNPIVKEKMRKYWLSDKKRLINKLWTRKYRLTPNGKHTRYLASIKRRIRVLHAKVNGRHTYHEWMNLLKKSKGFCSLCKSFIGVEKLTKDHIIPLNCKTGSSDSIDNIQPVCLLCNLKKKDKLRYIYE